MSDLLSADHCRLATRSRVTATICTVLALSACAETRIPVTTVLARPLEQEMPVYQPPPDDTGRPQAPTVENPTAAISLRDAVALALLHSPELATFAWETRAREARIVQAGKPPNPIVGAVAEDINVSRQPGSGLDRVIQPQATVQLSQIIELGGKRTARQQLATLNRELAAWDYEAARIEVLTQVTRAFVDVLAAQELVALTTRTTKLVEEVRQSVGARVVAGVVSPIEQTRAEVVLAAARVELDRATRLLDASRRRLVSFWGTSEPRFQAAVGDLAVRPQPPSLTELTTRVAENPDLARWASEISQRRAALALEQAKRVPDVTVMVGYRRYTDIESDAVIFGASIPLPIFDRNEGGIAEAENRLAKAYEEQRAAQARISAALAEAYRALSSADQEVTTLQSAVLPGSRQTFEAISEGYRSGKFGYLDVLDAQRTLIGASGQYLRTLADYHKAVADVERLTGTPLNVSTPTTTKE
jgi:cobalt-zinc-cadmium efflux system outer membrane protein